MCAQVLESGIAFHSVLIGIALGVSDSPCTIRPLLAALTFHQFFEGVALGSCLLQASFGLCCFHCSRTLISCHHCRPMSHATWTLSRSLCKLHQRASICQLKLRV